MSQKLDGKVIIVIGSNGLIGKEVIKKLDASNCKIIEADINSEVPSKRFFKLDIANNNSIDELIKHAMDLYGRIDGLVNLAYPRTKDWGLKFENIPFSSWRENVDLQLNSNFYLIQKVIEIMKKQKSGSIVNIASIYGVVGNDFSLYEEFGGTSPAAYSAIKGAIINLTRYLASYYGSYNVRVNCVSPGGVLDEEKQNPSFIERYSAKSPMKRLGRPDEMAGPIKFLLSEDSSYITGHNLLVDGGWTAI